LRISDAGGRRDLLPIGPPDDLQFALAIHLGRVWLVRRSGQDSTAFECRVLAANRNPVADPMPAETMFPLPVERRPIQVLDPHCRFIDIGTAAGAPSSARLIVLPHPIALRDAQPRRLDVDVRQKVIIRWRTQQADFPHCALGQDLTPSPTTGRGRAGSDVRARSTRRGARVDRISPSQVTATRGNSAAGSAWARLPPTVPRLRIW
jgi:hypothetical protein